MNKRFRFRTIILSLAASLAVTAVGYASWLAVNRSIDNKNVLISSTSTRAVCKNTTTSTEYTTIEMALSKAESGQTVYVYPSLTNDDGTIYEITINNDCEVKSGVTLSLPFEEPADTDEKILKRSAITEEFADRDEENVKANRTTKVTISKGKTLTNNGTLKIGGELGIGKSNQRPTGHTAGKYSEIVMGSNSKIQNNGTIELYGYIKEASSNNGSEVLHSSTASMTLPMVIYDFRGGDYSLYSYNQKTFPFNSFDMPNCQTTQIFNFGSKMTVTMMLYMQNDIRVTSANILSGNDDSLFLMSSGTLSLKYHSQSCLYTTNDVNNATTYEKINYTAVVANGEIALNKICVSIISISIDSSTLICPIPQKFRIFCESGSFDINNKTKFLSGSSVTVGEDAVVNINAETVFYQRYIPKITTGAEDLYPDLGSANLKVSGTLNINSNFAGFVEASGTNAKMSISYYCEMNVTTTEALSAETGNYGGKGTFEVHSENATAFYSADEKPSSASVLLSCYHYSSVGDYWVIQPSDTINELFISPNEGTSEAGISATYTITASYKPTYTNCTDISIIWSCDQGDSHLSSTSGDTITLTTDANATTTDIEYVLTCALTYKTAKGENKAVTTTGKYIAIKKADSDLGDITSVTFNVISKPDGASVELTTKADELKATTSASDKTSTFTLAPTLKPSENGVDSSKIKYNWYVTTRGKTYADLYTTVNGVETAQNTDINIGQNNNATASFSYPEIKQEAEITGGSGKVDVTFERVPDKTGVATFYVYLKVTFQSIDGTEKMLWAKAESVTDATSKCCRIAFKVVKYTG